ncbi:SHOCT domain-containing protein [Natronomonas halophila]|uniref:SHOCT domain-containing protein n=1 Tax=Natronomonas halophila TaxID=2747817 RepID=UPI0015B60F88|nr:SHOCT domain-containing protein [Natronomonas halophila]QLD85596.1 SHOCT domain-containing protein [Natronomonas halophila]
MESEQVPDDGDTPLEEVTAGVVITLTLLAGFGLLFAGFEFFWVAFPVGFAGLLPAAMGAVKYYQQSTDGTASSPSETDQALDDLRQRYARGELTEAEFEARVERLLETESVGDARDYADRIETRPEADRERER